MFIQFVVTERISHLRHLWVLERGPAVPAGWGCGCPPAAQGWELVGSSFLTAVVLADALKDHRDRAVLSLPAATLQQSHSYCSSSFLTSLQDNLE